MVEFKVGEVYELTTIEVQNLFNKGHVFRLDGDRKQIRNDPTKKMARDYLYLGKWEKIKNEDNKS